MDEAQKKQATNDPMPEALAQEIVTDENEVVEMTSENEIALGGIEDLSGVEDRNTGEARIIDNLQEHTANDPVITGGDIDADLEQAEVVGEEAVGGTTSTPDQNNVDELAASVGTEVFDQQDRYATDELEQRDSRRWELEPKSSEDYQERRDSIT